MLGANNLQPLDTPTLIFAGVWITALLGLFLIFAWLQDRNTRALAWWGAAYIIGSSSMALWNAPEALFFLPPEIPSALIFVACGMVWNGVRLFHGRKVLPLTVFAGGVAWIVLCQFPPFERSGDQPCLLGVAIVAVYVFFTAHEIRRERRKTRYGQVAKIVVPVLHGAVFLIPIAMKEFLPPHLSASWVEVFALETMLYGVGTAFIVLLMVKDHHVYVQRRAASTDPLTGLFNRRAFLEGSQNLCAVQSAKGLPVTLMMFDLDHFKSINDRYGHAVGDDTLRVFAATARRSMRASDIIGRLGGEEFAAIVPASMEVAAKIAARVRSGFERAGAVVGEHALGATVSVGAATGRGEKLEVEALLARADAALYRAKSEGRNRVRIAEDPPPSTDAAAPVASAQRAGREQPDTIAKKASPQPALQVVAR